MLYELIAIVRPGNAAEVKEIALTIGKQILAERGVIRGLSNWGIFSLPKPTTAIKVRHRTGHYFCMRFDASAATQKSVRKTLADDPRMIRHTSVKLGDGKLETMVRFGKVDWTSRKLLDRGPLIP